MTPRILPLQGGHNFRDLGGYATRDGRSVRLGQLYRSGSLTYLSSADLAHISTLGIKMIFDLRTSGERKSRPSLWPDWPAIDLWALEHDKSMAAIVGALADPHSTAAELRRHMLNTYRALPYELADSYRELFRSLANDRSPLLVHCSLGKDRTGVAAALLLTALGVEREAIISDYLVTGRFIDGTVRIVLSDPSSDRLQSLDREIWMPLVLADRSYIEAAFGSIEERHGTVTNYLEDVLGTNAALLEELRQKLIAPRA